MGSPITFTVITPTLQRKSLIECCRSVDMQTYESWLHVLMIDCAEVNDGLIFEIAHPKRSIFQCQVPHQDYGNTCRHNAWEHATENSYLAMLDDDNRFSDDRVLEDIAEALESAGRPDWAIFPILRHGRIFYNDPPANCHTDSANFLVKKEIGRWPIGDGGYTVDGMFVEYLKSQYLYAAFPNFRPIVVMEKSNLGRPDDSH